MLLPLPLLVLLLRRLRRRRRLRLRLRLRLWRRRLLERPHECRRLRTDRFDDEEG
jgi:hypothetical protein